MRFSFLPSPPTLASHYVSLELLLHLAVASVYRLYTTTPSRSQSRPIGIVSLVRGRSWWKIWVIPDRSNNAQLAEVSLGRGWCVKGSHANGLGAILADLCGWVRTPESHLHLNWNL